MLSWGRFVWFRFLDRDYCCTTVVLLPFIVIWLPARMSSRASFPLTTTVQYSAILLRRLCGWIGNWSKGFVWSIEGILVFFCIFLLSGGVVIRGALELVLSMHAI